MRLRAGRGSGRRHGREPESALDRGARIYAEIAGAAVNCGGQRGGGTMTLGNPEGVRRVIRAALHDADLLPPTSTSSPAT